ncbi:hypothetical protein KGM_215788 [Danaus plexippus plexippus]|uniref:Uncharacterized protein n=1 Tax=Danaus plexippus plexippus TaxID=278856 RepID=A0A212EYU3_DANPL|nr:hypothetical protein KGM_215788 [Danaus plexippus plexippus]
MKLFTFILFLVFCYAECRKTYAPIDKNANLAFINMESGGMRPPNNARPALSPSPPPAATQAPKAPLPVQTTPQPIKPVVSQPVKPANATVKPSQESKSPSQITPRPVYPTPASKLITTPGPGSVKQLVTFYDSQGKASPIRPYSYSQAVKQG